MEYFVIAPDGQQYGPASIDTLKQWVAENRITQATMLRHGPTGQTGAAGSVPGLFTAPSPGSPVVAPPAPAAAPDQTFAAGYEKPVPQAQPSAYSHTAGLAYQNPNQHAPQGNVPYMRQARTYPRTIRVGREVKRSPWHRSLKCRHLEAQSGAHGEDV